MSAPAAPHSAKRPRGAGLVHVAEAIGTFFAELELEAQERIELASGIEGPVRGCQRGWSRVLDEIEAERERGAA